MKRMMMVMMLVVGLVFSAAAFAQGIDDLSGREWHLISLGGAEMVPGTTITLGFGDDNRVFGSSGCNSYGASYSVNAGEISFGMAISTMMACMQEGVMEQEMAYLAALEAATGYELAGDQLIITYGAGEQLIFELAPMLDGTSWQLVSLDGADAIGTVTLLFGADGRATGSTDCNSFSAVYSVDGAALRLGPVLSPRAACVDEAQGTQELAFLLALEAASDYALTAEELVITYGDGSQLVFVGQTALMGTQWSLVTLDGAEVVAGTQVTLEFGAEGMAYGETGCNLFRTSYSHAGQTIDFGENIVTTRRACVIEGAADQERAYLAALTGATTYALEGDTLTISGERGELVFARLNG